MSQSDDQKKPEDVISMASMQLPKPDSFYYVRYGSPSPDIINCIMHV